MMRGRSRSFARSPRGAAGSVLGGGVPELRPPGAALALVFLPSISSSSSSRGVRSGKQPLYSEGFLRFNPLLLFSVLSYLWVSMEGRINNKIIIIISCF